MTERLREAADAGAADPGRESPETQDDDLQDVDLQDVDLQDVDPETGGGAADDPAGGWALPAYAEEVLDVVDAIPEGHVMTYGDIAELVGRGGPRQVGSVMSHYGSATTWWRVIRADGRPPACHEGEAHRHYLVEGTPLRGERSERVDLRVARWSGRAG